MIKPEVNLLTLDDPLVDMRHVSAHVATLHLQAALAPLSQPKKRSWRLLGLLAAILIISLFSVLPGDTILPDPSFHLMKLDIGWTWVHYRGTVDLMMNLPAVAKVGDAYRDSQGVTWVYMPGVNPMPWYDP